MNWESFRGIEMADVEIRNKIAKNKLQVNDNRSVTDKKQRI